MCPLTAPHASANDSDAEAWHPAPGLVHQAVILDPTVIDKFTGIAAIEQCLAAHADLPTYG